MMVRDRTHQIQVPMPMPLSGHISRSRTFGYFLVFPAHITPTYTVQQRLCSTVSCSPRHTTPTSPPPHHHHHTANHHQPTIPTILHGQHRVVSKPLLRAGQGAPRRRLPPPRPHSRRRLDFLCGRERTVRRERPRQKSGSRQVPRRLAASHRAHPRRGMGLGVPPRPFSAGCAAAAAGPRPFRNGQQG